MNRTFGILLILGLSFTGCQQENETSFSRQMTIGISLDSLVVERWVGDLRELEKNARSFGARVITRVALGSLDKQKNDLREMIEEGVGVLVVVPTQAAGLVEEVSLAQSLGVPVVSYDRLILQAPISAYVSFDTVQVGREMAQGFLQNPGGGRLILINGGANDHNTLLLNRGIMEILRPSILQNRIEIVKEFWPKEWSTVEFSQDLERYIQSGKEVDGIIAGNDQFATEAIRIINRLAGDREIQVFGQDADLVAAQNIALGFQSGTVYKPITLLAKKTIEIAYQLSIGEVLRDTEFISNGAENIPVFYIPPVYVNQRNLRDFLDSTGYHKIEDVYSFVEEAHSP